MATTACYGQTMSWTRPDLAERNRSPEHIQRVKAALKGRKKNYRCGPLPRDLKERLYEKCLPVPWTGCWLWLGALDPDGYGSLHVEDRKQRAHRVSFEIFRGGIPAGRQIDHLCRVRCCVNPDHLEPVTCKENLLRGDTLNARNATKTHCKRGHIFDEANTIKVPHGRECRTCRNAQSLAAYHRKKVQ